MNFAEAEAYLLSLGNEVSAMKLGLDNMRALLAELGNPHEKYIKVQIAGTNGKGSVCAFLKSICLEAGINAGVYTSPHLVSVTERLNICGDDISEIEFAKLATRVRDVTEQMLAEGRLDYRPTFFEQVTAIALVAFADADVDLAILETGLGGRLDATTAANAEITAITRIDYDHQEYLGETMAKIAAEKTAVIRRGSKAVVAPQDRVATRIISGHCKSVDIEPVWVKAHVALSPRKDDYSYAAVFNTGAVTIFSNSGVYKDVSLGLWGKHQWDNAGVAIEIAELLRRDFQVEIDHERIRDGLENARHPGRLEYERIFLLDGAHNVGGARALAYYINEFLKHPFALVFGAMRGKQVGEIAKELFPRFETVILTSPRNSRALKAAEIKSLIPEGVYEKKLILTDSVEEALKIAPYHSGGSTIVVTGSLYLVGEAKRILRSKI